jgi:hypothetical protein
MLAALGRSLRHIFGYRSIEIVEQSPLKLAVSYGPTVTVLDKSTSEVTQGGKLVGMIPLIADVQVHQPMSQASTPVWYVTIRLSGRRFVEVGQATGQEEAMHVAALISALVGRPIKTHA